jgi:N-acetylglucosamine-6-phosphate deacetylase
MAIILKNANILTPLDRIEDGAVVVSEEGLITYVGSRESMLISEGLHLDMHHKWVVPGLVDIHVHGGHGVDFSGREDVSAALGEYALWAAQHGVTAFVCSLAAPDPSALRKKIRSYVEVLGGYFKGAQPIGLHLEGPYLSPKQKGAYASEWLRKPSPLEVKSLLEAGEGWIRQITLAPELPGAEETAAMCSEAGVVVAMGHTDADYERARQALAGHWTHVTHTYNAMRGFSHRDPGALGAVLTSDQATAEVIADGFHVHQASMRILLRCLGVDRIVLVSDANMAAGLGDGQYQLLDQPISVAGGRATREDGSLAGSTQPLIGCLHEVTKIGGVSLQQGLQMMTRNPADAMHLSNGLGGLEVGQEAHLTVIDEEMHVYLTMVKGEIVHSRQ